MKELLSVLFWDYQRFSERKDISQIQEAAEKHPYLPLEEDDTTRSS